MNGFDVVMDIKEPDRVLPKEWNGQKVVLRFTGGVGDVVMGIGGTAFKLRDCNCVVDAAVMERQSGLIESMVGVDSVIATQKLNNPRYRSEYDVLIEFSNVLNYSRQLKDDDYYKLISERVGVDIGPGSFQFGYNPRLAGGQKSVFLHAGASNPNRRWPNENWKELAYRLVSMGYRVVWLGDSSDYGFTDIKNGAFLSKIQRLSEIDISLEAQAKEVARSAYWFVGNDSCFAHVAGVLGVPGVVLFSVTHYKNVICRYSTLKGIENFESLGLEPTRSLRIDDPIGRQLMDSISVKQVLNGLEKIGCL